jgi:hypothetical protein
MRPAEYGVEVNAVEVGADVGERGLRTRAALGHARPPSVAICGGYRSNAR